MPGAITAASECVKIALVSDVGFLMSDCGFWIADGDRAVKSGQGLSGMVKGLVSKK